jgi:hypothetical protein
MARVEILAVLACAALAAASCSKERKAEADTGTASAEVKTELPQSQVSDTQLKAAAEGAAAVAETPQGSNTAVVVTPPTGSPPAGTPGTSSAPK